MCVFHHRDDNASRLLNIKRKPVVSLDYIRCYVLRLINNITLLNRLLFIVNKNNTT